MQPKDFDPSLSHDSWHRLEELLKRRRDFWTQWFFGREPTVDPALPDAVARVKAMGFKVGLHTGGIIPARLARLLPMLDWVGIDVKAPPTDAVLYERVTGRTHAALHFLEAFRMLQKAGIHLNVEPPLTLTIFPIRNF